MDVLTLASSSLGNCHRLSDGTTSLLLDAGITIQRIRQGLSYRLSSVDGCLISHSHMDHCKAAHDLIRAGMDIYASRETLSALAISGEYRAHEISKHNQFTINSFVVMPFEAQHDCDGTLGFLIYSKATKEKLLYLTDSFYCRYKFKGLNYVMIECNYADDLLKQNVGLGNVPEEHRLRLLRSHFNLDRVKEFLRANDLSCVREIYLMHLSDGNSDAERFKREIQAVTGKRVIVCQK